MGLFTYLLGGETRRNLKKINKMLPPGVGQKV